MWNRRPRLSSHATSSVQAWQETTPAVPLRTDGLVIQPQCEQHFSHVAGVGYQTKGSAADICVRIAEIRPVESVEHLPAELQLGAFFQSKVLGQDSVPGLRPGSRQDVARRISVKTAPILGLYEGGGVKNRHSGFDSVAHATRVEVAVLNTIGTPTELIG